MRARSVLVALLAGVVSVVSAASASGQAPAQCGTTHWVGAWTADPSGTLGSGFSGQTLRIILTPHIASSEIRVHLSNKFGPKPVTFNHATIALRQSGAALVPATTHQLTFAGQAAVTIPAGGEAISDPAPLTFAAFQDLAVSLYLADATGPATGHYIARERSYATPRSSGDHTTEDTPAAFVSSTTTASYLDAADAQAPALTGTAVLFGDSITDGYENAGPGNTEEQGGIDLNHRYPDYLAHRILDQPGSPHLSIVNAGISGNRILVDGQQSISGQAGLSRLDSDVLGVAGVTDAIVLEGINDIALLASADQVDTALRQIVSRLHARGVHVLIGTISPAGTGLLNLGNLLPAIFIPSSANGVRLAVNAWIRSGASGADGIIDFDAALRGTAQPNELDPGLDSGDHVHPSYLGYKKMADMVDLTNLRGAQCSPAPPPKATHVHFHASARTPRHLRVTGSLTGAGDCTGAVVTVKALRGRVVLNRRVRLTAACRFSITRSIAQPGRLEVRVSFGGSPTLLPSKARSVHVRIR